LLEVVLNLLPFFVGKGESTLLSNLISDLLLT
jgi:hypothetical protein